MVVVSENQKGPSTIFKTNKGKQLTDTLPYVENIIKYFRGAFGVEVTKIAADFIKDESGIWWMINIKSISFKEKITEGRIKKVVNGEDDEEIGTSAGQSGPKRPEGYQKIKLCRYCETPFHAEDLNNKMNLKMVMELDKHLKVRGYNFDWLDRGERQFVDTSNLYEVHLVCRICYKLYEQMVQLNKYFEAFSTDCGIHFKSEKNDQTVSITTLKEKKVPELETSPSGLQNNDDGSEDEHDQHKSNNNNNKYDPAGIIRISNDTYLQQKPRLLNRFRFVTFLQCVNDIPVRQIKTHPPDSFSIEIDVLDQVLHYKIEMQYLQKQKDEPQVEGEKKKEFCRIDMNRLSVKYFFSHERQSLRTYIHQAKTIEMRLRKNQEKEPLYAFQIELQDFVSEQVPTRNYQKYFTVDTDHINDLAWELVFTLGVHEDPEPVDVSGMVLKDFKGLIIPPQSYYSYEPLHESWTKILNRRDVQKVDKDHPAVKEFQDLPTYKKEQRPVLSGRAPSEFNSSYMKSDQVQKTPRLNQRTPRASEAKYELEGSEGEEEDYDYGEEEDEDMYHDEQEDQYSKSFKQGSKYTDKRTEVGDDKEQHGSGTEAETDDMLLEELDHYNHKLNKEVGRVLNDQR